MTKKKEEKIKIEKDKNVGKVLSDGTTLRKKRINIKFKYFVAVCLVLILIIGCLYFYIENNVNSVTRKCNSKGVRNCTVITDKKGNQLFQCEYCKDSECTDIETITCQAYGGVKNG